MIVKFGKQCDACGVLHNDYSVGDIAYCDDCEQDLCDACAEPEHVVVKEWDVDTERTRSCEEA